MLIYHLHLTKKLNRIPFLNVQNIHENIEFTMSVYCKSTFRRIYTNFEILLRSTYSFDTVYILAHRCFRVCSGRTKSQTECRYCKLIRCFKKTMEEITCKKLKYFLTVEKVPLVLVLPYFVQYPY